MTTKPTIVFLGTPEFAKTILQTLHVRGFPILAVIAQPDKPVGRGQALAAPPVAQFATDNRITLWQPAKIRDEAVLHDVQKLKPDFLVVAAYGKILPQTILDVARFGAINVHASLLPKYRGAAPIQHAILNNDAKTGVAIMQMVLALDAGPVFAQRELPITDNDSTATLTTHLAHLGADLLCETLPRIVDHTLTAVPQNEEGASYAAKITKEMARIRWDQPARSLFNQIRALQPWPVAEARIHGQRVRCFEATALTTRSAGVPGQIVHIAATGLTLATGFGDLLLRSCQAEGKKRVSAFEFANGFRLQVGDRFE